MHRDAANRRLKRRAAAWALVLLTLTGCGRPVPVQEEEPVQQVTQPVPVQETAPSTPIFMETEILPQEASPAESSAVTLDLALQETIAQAVAGYGGAWSVYFEDVTHGRNAQVGDGAKTAASLIKLFVAGAYLQAVEDGSLEDLWQGELEAMITVSSNEACNRLLEVLEQEDAQAGMTRVNEFAAGLGCGDTMIQRQMLEASPLENFTSPRDCATLLKAALDGTLVSEAASKRLVELLCAQTRRNKIPAGLPQDVTCGNKTGELADMENDVAIVWTNAGTYLLCVMVEDVTAPGQTQSDIAALSALVYGAYSTAGDSEESKNT